MTESTAGSFNFHSNECCSFLVICPDLKISSVNAAYNQNANLDDGGCLYRILIFQNISKLLSVHRHKSSTIVVVATQVSVFVCVE